MRVTIDAVPLLFRSAGVKNYLHYWIEHLRGAAKGTEIRLFPWITNLPSLNHEASIADPVTTHLRVGMWFLMNRIAGLEQLLGSSDIFHSTKLLRPPRGARLTATLYDCTCWLMPEMHAATNVAFESQFAERILRRADGLIAISENTRQDAVRVLGLPPEKIHVIYPGVPTSFFEVTPEMAGAVVSRYGLTRPYVLFVGTIEPRKNVDLLLDAYAALPASTRAEYELVLAGPEGWASPKTRARLQTPPAGIRYLGYVGEADLAGLYAGATAFVYPSLYEGFGFPVAQAMAAGVPVVTSNLSSLPEITGGAALLTDPRSEGELREALNRILTSSSVRATLKQQARPIAARYSWAECASQSVRFFEDVAGTRV